jgi:type I restriction enzyme S subunit
MIGASGRQRVQESCFDKLLILVPSRSLLALFSEAVEPVFEQIKVLHLQNQKLRTARDLLLPRLMSGEIAV